MEERFFEEMSDAQQKARDDIMRKIMENTPKREPAIPERQPG